MSSDGGSSFSNVSGATGATLTVSGTAAAQNGYEYEAIFTQLGGHGDQQRRHADGRLRADRDRQSRATRP